MDTPLVINIDTGVISFQNEQNDEQINVRRISRENARRINSGELDVKVVLAAIKKHIASSDEFDLDEILKQRAKLNVRKTALVPDKQEKKLKDRSAEEVSEVEIAAAKEEAKRPKKDVVDKAVEDAAEDAPKAKKSKAPKMDEFFGKE